MTPEELCAALHKLLDRLALRNRPGPDLPENGLYFFYEEGEISAHAGLPRIVRVGNHPASQNGLVGRLRNHYSGNKNSSVFRKFLGGAIMRRGDPNRSCLRPAHGKGHWEKQDAKTCQGCRPIETEVSRLLRERFRFRCVEIAEKGERNSFEAKLIAALSRCSECRPSSARLGHYAYSDMVRRSGLWNSRQVDSPLLLNAEDLERLEALVEQTAAGTGTQPLRR